MLDLYFITAKGKTFSFPILAHIGKFLFVSFCGWLLFFLVPQSQNASNICWYPGFIRMVCHSWYNFKLTDWVRSCSTKSRKSEAHVPLGRGRVKLLSIISLHKAPLSILRSAVLCKLCTFARPWQYHLHGSFLHGILKEACFLTSFWVLTLSEGKKLRFYFQQWCCQPCGLLQSYKSSDNHVSGTNSLTNSVALFPHWKGSQSNPETRIFISALGRCNCWIHYMSLSYCVCPDFSFIFWISFPLLPSLPTPAVKPYQTSFLTLFFLF